LGVHRGPIAALPFDLRGRRVIPYSATEGERNRSQERAKLASALRPHVVTALADAPVQESAPDVRVSVERRMSVAMVGPPNPIDCIMLKVMNYSKDPVFLAGVSFELEDGALLAGLRDVVGAFIQPKRLEPGESAVTGVSVADLEEAARGRQVVHVFVTDQLERRYHAPTEAVEAAMADDGAADAES